MYKLLIVFGLILFFAVLLFMRRPTRTRSRWEIQRTELSLALLKQLLNASPTGNTHWTELELVSALEASRVPEVSRQRVGYVICILRSAMLVSYVSRQSRTFESAHGIVLTDVGRSVATGKRPMPNLFGRSVFTSSKKVTATA